MFGLTQQRIRIKGSDEVLLSHCLAGLGAGPVSSSEKVAWQALAGSDVWRGCEDKDLSEHAGEERVPGRGVKTTAVPELFLRLLQSGIYGSSFGEWPAHNWFDVLFIHFLSHSFIHAMFPEYLLDARRCARSCCFTGEQIGPAHRELSV